MTKLDEAREFLDSRWNKQIGVPFGKACDITAAIEALIREVFAEMERAKLGQLSNERLADMMGYGPVTPYGTASATSDGRPCSADEAVLWAVENIDDGDELREFFRSWAYGDWADIEAIMKPQEGGDRNQLDQRPDREDKTPPAIGEMPVAGDVAKQLAEAAEAATTAWKSMPKGGSLFAITKRVIQSLEPAMEKLSEALAAYRKETDT